MSSFGYGISIIMIQSMSVGLGHLSFGSKKGIRYECDSPLFLEFNCIYNFNNSFKMRLMPQIM